MMRMLLKLAAVCFNPVLSGCDWMSANLAKMEVPFVVFHGCLDTVTDPLQSQLFHDQASSLVPCA